MGTLLQLLAKVEAIDFQSEVADLFQGDEKRIAELVRQQLLSGRDRDGNLITPTYFNDPYFKTQQGAQMYSAWKDRIDPAPDLNRPSGTPNLYIDGTFHDSIQVVITRQAIYTDSYNHKIVGKFPNVLGLSPETKAKIIAEKKALFIRSIGDKTGLR